MARSPVDSRPLVGEPLALDLLNTEWIADGAPVDLLTSLDGLGAWLRSVPLDVAATPETASALIETRSAIREMVTRHSASGRQRLNAVLDHGRLRLSLGPSGTVERVLEVDEARWLPAVRAAGNLLELLESMPDRIHRCSHPACVLWFLDTTRNGTRRWCSMAACGNRVKASRHYDRTRRPSLVASPAPIREPTGLVT